VIIVFKHWKTGETITKRGRVEFNNISSDFVIIWSEEDKGLMDIRRTDIIEIIAEGSEQ
tara:strand:+ start:344 stop:520 length:177 start_codon:yes stop_codon:yes gene_type:complete